MMDTKISQHFLKIILPIHVLFFVLVFFVEINWWQIFVGWILISGFGIAIGFHRLFSHKSFETYDPIKYILAILGSLGAQGSPIFWAGLHRGIHHKFTDTEKDIHSPVHGFFSSYVGWQIFFDPKMFSPLAVKDLLKDKNLVFIHNHYNKILYFILVSTAVIDYDLMFNFLLIPMLVSMHQENIINSFCHSTFCGYKNFKTQDNSNNILLLGWLCWGHGFHNNHHAYPGRSDYGSKWYELDLTKFFIRIIKKK